MHHGFSKSIVEQGEAILRQDSKPIGEIEAEFVDFFNAYYAQDVEVLKKYRFSLCDYSRVTRTDVSTRSLRHVAAMAKRASSFNPDVIVAFVTAQGLTFGLARMWAVFADETHWEIEFFDDAEAAKNWIGKRMQEKHGMEGLSFA